MGRPRKDGTPARKPNRNPATAVEATRSSKKKSLRVMPADKTILVTLLTDGIARLEILANESSDGMLRFTAGLATKQYSDLLDRINELDV